MDQPIRINYTNKDWNENNVPSEILNWNLKKANILKGPKRFNSKNNNEDS